MSRRRRRGKSVLVHGVRAGGPADQPPLLSRLLVTAGECPEPPRRDDLCHLVEGALHPTREEQGLLFRGGCDESAQLLLVCLVGAGQVLDQGGARRAHGGEDVPRRLQSGFQPLLVGDRRLLPGQSQVSTLDVSREAIDGTAPEPSRRLTDAARRLVRHGTCEQAVLVGLGLLAGNAEAIDIDAVKTMWLLVHLDSRLRAVTPPGIQLRKPEFGVRRVRRPLGPPVPEMPIPGSPRAGPGQPHGHPGAGQPDLTVVGGKITHVRVVGIAVCPFHEPVTCLPSIRPVSSMPTSGGRNPHAGVG